MVSDSRFNMWRAVIAMAHADHKLVDEEVKFISEKIKKGQMDEKQIEKLFEDLNAPARLEDVLPKITEPSDRSMLVYYARLLAWADDECAEQEDILLKLMRENALSQIDIESELNAAHAYAKQHADEFELYLQKDAGMPKPRTWVSKSFDFFVDLFDRI